MRTNFSKYGVRIPTDSGKPLDIPKVSASLKISTDVTMDSNGSPIRFAYINDTLCATEFPGAPTIDIERLVWKALSPISENIKKEKGVEAPPSMVTESVEGTRGRIVHFTDIENLWGPDVMHRISSQPILTQEDKDTLAKFLKKIVHDIENTPQHIRKFESVGEYVKPLLRFMVTNDLDFKPLASAFSQVKKACNNERDHVSHNPLVNITVLDEAFVSALHEACADVAKYADIKNMELEASEQSNAEEEYER